MEYKQFKKKYWEKSFFLDRLFGKYIAKIKIKNITGAIEISNDQKSFKENRMYSIFK